MIMYQKMKISGMKAFRGEIKMNFTLQLIYRELCGGCIKYIRYAKIRFQAGLAKKHCDIRAKNKGI